MEMIDPILKDLMERSIYIINEAKAQFKNPCTLWSTGKDSTTLLYLIKLASPLNKVDIPVVHIDTGWKFPEVYEFRDRIAKLWDLDLRIAKHPLAGKINPVFGNITHEECCQKLKTEALRNFIEENGFDAVFVAIRRDEHYMRNIERHFSPRDRNFRWKFLRKKEEGEKGDAPFESLQPIELWDIYASDFGEDVHHVRIHPILDWSEIDVWRFVKAFNLPVNPLYFSKGGYRYRSLGCRTCTFQIKSEARTIDEIIEEIKTSRERERAGRHTEKEEVMRKLRALGYL